MLRNTCAGFKELNTFGEMARIHVTESMDGSDDHMELTFDEDTKEGLHRLTAVLDEAVEISFGALSRGAVKPGEEYGDHEKPPDGLWSNATM